MEGQGKILGMLASGRSASPQNSSSSNGRGTRTRGGKPAPRYEVLERLGEGSLWIAYRVRDRSMANANSTPVTLKALKTAPNRHPRLPGALMSELEAWQPLAHPALVTPLDIGVEEGTLFFTCEYLPGASLETHLGRGALAPETAIAALRALAPTLRFLHEKGIAHGDVRPRQVLFDAGTHAKLSDGGVAQAFVDSGLSLVDLQNEAAFYLAPEMTPGTVPTLEADIYALGVLLYRMLTGRIPFDGVSTLSIAARHRSDAPLPITQLKPRLDAKWDDLAMRLLAKDPASRPTAAQLDEWLRSGSTGSAAASRRGALSTLPASDIPAIDEMTVVGSNPTIGVTNGVSIAAPVASVPVPGGSAAGVTAASAASGAAVAAAHIMPNVAGVDDATVVGTVPKRRPLNKLAEEELAAQDEATRERNYKQARKKFRRREFWGAFGALIWLFILMGGSVGATYAAYHYWIKESPVEVTVPSYVGKNQRDAQQILAKKGLMFRVVREAYDPKLPEGTVIAGEPEAGRHVRAKREVLVTVSAGAAPIKMVDFARLTLDQARQIITRHGLRLGQVIQQFHESVPPGFVCGQFPESGESLRRSEPITLIVSRGPQPKQIDAQAGLGDPEVADPDAAPQATPATLDDDSSFAPLEPANPGAGTGANGLVTRRATVRVKVPPADGNQIVRIVVRDANGERTVYQHAHRGGERISQVIGATRAKNEQALVRIYVGEELIKEEQL